MEEETMKKIRIVAIVFLLLLQIAFVSKNGTVVGAVVSDIQVTVYPSSPYVNAQYTITFNHDVQGTFQVIISGLQASQAPMNQNVQGITVNGSPVVSQCSFNGSSVTLFINSTSLRSGSNTIFIPLSVGIFNPAPGSYQLSITTEGSPSLSNFYQIGASQVNNLNVQVNPPINSSTAQYKLTFQTSSNGQLYANTNYVYVQFPLGTDLPNSIPGSYVKVNNIPCSGSISVDTINRIISIPIPLNIYSNQNVNVEISNQALIKNPALSGTYKIILWTTADSTKVESNTYQISSSYVSNFLVNVNPATVNSVADYQLKFTTSNSGELIAGVDSIMVAFPQEALVSSATIDASKILVNGKPSSKAVLSNNNLIITVPVSILANATVEVSISKDIGIKTPSSAGSYKLGISTSKDLNVIYSTFSITNTTLSDVYVIVVPSIVNEVSSFTIQFSTGSQGALGLGDYVKIRFPEEFYLPGSIDKNSVTLNGLVPNALSFSAQEHALLVYLPNGLVIGGNSKVICVISSSVGIKNPSSASDSYYLEVSTSKEQTSIKSNNFSIYGSPTTSLIITPSDPDGRNGFYVTKPTITFKANDIPGLTITIYYKIDQGNFVPFTSPFSLGDGEHTITFYSKTSTGQTEPMKSKTIKVDTTPPVINVIQPKEGETFVQNPIKLSGYTEPGSTITINNQVLSVDESGNFSADIIANEGKNEVEIFATDKSGNTSKMVVSFYYNARVIALLQVGNTKSYVNNEAIELEKPPFIYNGRVMV
ncbi:MAG: hypothetical protein QXQ64_09170, partial [Candidatus Bathyarchaeia archaeon]